MMAKKVVLDLNNPVDARLTSSLPFNKGAGLTQAAKEALSQQYASTIPVGKRIRFGRHSVGVVEKLATTKTYKTGVPHVTVRLSNYAIKYIPLDIAIIAMEIKEEK